MATNENVNKVIYGNQTVMDITDTTAEESDVASGEVFYKADGSRSVGTLNADSAVWGNISGTLSDQTDLQTELNRAYIKTASETSSIDDLDLIPVQKIFASSDGRRNVKFRNLKSILKGFFDDIYQAILTFDNTPTVNSDNPVKSSGIYNALMPKVSESLLKSTVGWSGKNKFDNHQDFFVGFIDVTNNKFVLQTNYYMGIVPVKPNTEYIITKQEGKTFRIALSTDKPAKDVAFRYTEANHTGTEITVTTGANDNYLSILFWSSTNGDTGTYQQMADTVMVRDASITDDTYEPYHESVEEEIEQIYADNGVLGAKNLLPNNAKTQTINGVTFTVNADGSVTANGTATANAQFTLFDGYITNDNKDIILSGSPANGSQSAHKLSTWNYDKSQAFNDYGEGVFISGSSHFQVSITIYSGYTADNLVFYPMIRLASDPDDTYVPYAMTNREITEAMANIVTDDWTTTSQVQSDGTVTFTGLNDNYGYDLYCENKLIGYSAMSKTGSGTSVQIVYTVTGAASGDVCKLRILK